MATSMFIPAPQSAASYRSVSTATALTPADGGVVLLVDATSAAVAVSLPTAVGNDGLAYTIKNAGQFNNVTVVPSGIETIEGQTGVTALTLIPGAVSRLLPGAISCATIVARNGSWFITESA